MWSTGSLSTPKLLKFQPHLCPFQGNKAIFVWSCSVVLRTHPPGFWCTCGREAVEFSTNNVKGIGLTFQNCSQEVVSPLPTSSQSRTRFLVVPLSLLAFCSKEITSTCTVNYFWLKNPQQSLSKLSSYLSHHDLISAFLVEGTPRSLYQHQLRLSCKQRIMAQETAANWFVQAKLPVPGTKELLFFHCAITHRALQSWEGEKALPQKPLGMGHFRSTDTFGWVSQSLLYSQR